MAVIGPQNKGIPGYTAGPKPIIPKTVGPQNAGLPSYRPGDINNPTGTLHGLLSAPAAPAPVAPAAPVAPDFNALANADPEYTTGVADLQRQNQLSLDQMLKSYLGNSQGAQDNANSHGALFSGAAVHAQNYAGQQYADAAAQQAANLQQSQHTLYSNVYNRLIQQLSGVTT